MLQDRLTQTSGGSVGEKLAVIMVRVVVAVFLLLFSVMFYMMGTYKEESSTMNFVWVCLSVALAFGAVDTLIRGGRSSLFVLITTPSRD